MASRGDFTPELRAERWATGLPDDDIFPVLHQIQKVGEAGFRLLYADLDHEVSLVRFSGFEHQVPGDDRNVYTATPTAWA